MTSDEVLKLAELRAALNKQMESWDVDSDLEGALWLVRRAIDGRGDVATAIREAEAVLATIQRRQEPHKPLEVRVIGKAEYDALMDKPATQSIDREAYERLMQEAQE
jgi:hypothetical protein